jgi:hypothetical protein
VRGMGKDIEPVLSHKSVTLPAIYSEPETVTTASSARSLVFFALFRRLRSLSRCLALCISPFDSPGLLMSSSYTTLLLRWQVKMGLPDLV